MKRAWKDEAVYYSSFTHHGRAFRLLVLGVVIVAVTGGLSQLLPVHWWMRSGIESNPGNFIARQPIDYPVCAPWKDKESDFARPDLQVTDSFSQEPVANGDQTTLGVALPAKARIVKIYCAVGPKECSFLGCEPPLSILATDAVYSRSRFISLAFPNTRQSAPLNFRVWVVWK